MNVINAVRGRRSIRKFKPDEIPRNVLEEIFDAARWSPSWGNTQSCEITVLTGQPLEDLRRACLEKTLTKAPFTPDIPMPETWPDSQKKRYGEIGKIMFTALDIKRDDKEGRNRFYQDMARLFDAPCLVVACVPSGVLVEYALLDVGLMLQTVCLLAHEKGLGTCIMAASVGYPELLRKVASIPEDRKIVMGITMGYPDLNHPLNKFERARIGMEEFVRWVK
jgi:nitroreductase